MCNFLFCRSDDKDITVEDLYLLCDLFYLPFEHGSRSLQIINEFYWLKTNASVLVSSYKKGQDISSAKPEVCWIFLEIFSPEINLKTLIFGFYQVQEWFQRAEKFYNICHSVIMLAKKIASCANKELCYDLYSYVWDMAGVITLLCAFIKWLGKNILHVSLPEWDGFYRFFRLFSALGYFPVNINSYTQGNYTCKYTGFNKFN